MIDREKMEAVLNEMGELNAHLHGISDPMAIDFSADDTEAWDAIRALIRTAPDPDDVKRLVEAAEEMIARRERAVKEYPGRSADGSDGRYARLRSALAPFKK